MKRISKDQVLKVLNRVNDPELRLGIVDLGLVYSVDISENNDVSVAITVTTPGCPVIGLFLEQAKKSIKTLPGVGKANVKLTFTPLWTPDRIKPEVRAKLGL